MSALSKRVTCPICESQVTEVGINEHIDKGCEGHVVGTVKSEPQTTPRNSQEKAKESQAFASIFRRPTASQHAPSPVLSGSSNKRKHQDTPTNGRPSKRERTNLDAAAPLAEKLRPTELEDFVGQHTLLGKGSLLAKAIEGGRTGSIIFWGPPGCGKTTLARMIAKRTDATFRELSATVAGINDVRAIFDEAKGALALVGRKTLLFVDEIHRFSKSQQDVFLPYLETGAIQLMGATTENPSFKLTSALLSRCRVCVLERLKDDEIEQVIVNGIERVAPSNQSMPTLERVQAPELEEAIDIPGSSQPSVMSISSQNQDTSGPRFPAVPHLTPKILASIVSLSTGDARTALGLLEYVLGGDKDTPEDRLLESLKVSVAASYDRTGDDHYDLVSALHKSVRASEGSAAIYWLARMLDGGEDPMFIARRMAVCASEDIGLADNHALPLAMATMQACQLIGMPECRINLAHLVSYLSEAPKSTRAYEAYKRASAVAKQDLTLAVPKAVRNAPTKLMKDLGYGKTYAYNPDYAHPVTNDYVPEKLKDEVFLQTEEDYASGKTWDEDALRHWETEKNGGEEWEGRKDMDKYFQ